MEREIDLKQISDGKFYLANDMVKAGCNDCAGCSLCCQGMGSSIILDPYDINSMEKGTGASFEELEQMTLGALRKAVVEGDTVNGTLMAGQSAGLVKGELSCSEIIREVMQQGGNLLNP